jgi:hypothetical protein
MTGRGGWLLVALALAGGAGSCSSDGGTGPVAGVLTVALATPNPGADGAILFRLSGPQVLTSVTAGPGLRVFSQALSLSTRIAVTGTLTNGAVVTIGVADTRKATQYTATVQAVAAQDFQLRPLTGYSLRVSP